MNDEEHMKAIQRDIDREASSGIIAEWQRDGEGWIDTELAELRDLIAVALAAARRDGERAGLERAAHGPHDYDGTPRCTNCGVEYDRVTTPTWCEKYPRPRAAQEEKPSPHTPNVGKHPATPQKP